jgi:hypothetical protein
VIIVAGHITVDPGQRAAYLAGRVNVVERWESPQALEAFRDTPIDGEQPSNRFGQGPEVTLWP